MTTTVTVKANHGWPVDVAAISTGPYPVAPKARVPAGATLDFYVHSGQDLLVHEVQPSELAAEAAEFAPVDGGVAA